MTGRDRMVLVVLLALALVGASWMLVVSPERKKANEAASQVSSAQAQLTSAESTLHNAQAAQREYAAAYQAIVGLGKAVPAAQEVPSLIYELEAASSSKKVEFASIVNGGGTTTPGSSSSSVSAVTAPTGFSPMPFSFVFNGTFFDLEHLFGQLADFTTRVKTGLQVKGRLLTIQSVKLAPATTNEQHASKVVPLTGTITASAYVLPASQGLTSGATPGGPAGATGTPASGAHASSSAAPAVVRVTP